MNFKRKRSEKTGLSPGSYVFLGEQKVEKTQLTIMDYDSQVFEFRDCQNIEEVFPYKEKETITWVNLYGLHETDNLKKIGEHFNIHPLIIEDILNTKHRPKVEIFEDYVFCTIKYIRYNPESDELEIEQVSIIMLANFIFCFQERKGDIFRHLRERIQNARGRIRKSGSDYLWYTILDIIVDNYFLVVESISDRIEELEDEVEAGETETVQSINNLKRVIIRLRKNIWPVREMLGSILRDESSFFKDSTIPFIRDLYDHTIHVLESVETYREMITGVMELHNSAMSNKMNEIMKVLTIIATIFIPLTFFAGIYGMNFEFMPELKWQWGYFGLLGFMLIIFLSMLYYFKRKKWL
ncbi:MAG: magnesium and cobalt transport protein CorA [Calditrichaeota bacterium]|nr:MAG: magnesium and cobalt transport protein CorA [Calditrichota bacterium]